MTASVLVALVPAATAAARPTQVSDANLAGTFQMTGRITVAKNVRGEHRGQIINRVWTFTAHCSTGQCQTVALVRTRGSGTDRLVLHLHSPAHYTGKGSFYAPLRCGNRIYHRGERVPFQIAVTITRAGIQGLEVVATAITATYTNRKRINLTPCVGTAGTLGHDAAAYTGTPLTQSG
jgi:hypothetical protein